MRIDAGTNNNKYCDGLSRRSFVQVGVAGMAAASMSDVLRAKEAADPSNKKSCILSGSTVVQATWTCTT